ncbi:hypothetical protein H310_10266 [Aphanomyces invadans]|uniref:Uncharacterized protein n=1 Tax=Aphanomyces invadans TaxID=157072 RepID=A0A024TSE2_9STRA|nr:hypothetical protein H310_10266 [Aphanomyces invadans]ETV96556.1 hypothetical protein H310_10266 [Aphanomyces invadans]|eukprot:XP_008874819.1 hypothetical protein H310_10266 [Aphanomyces invadans]
MTDMCRDERQILTAHLRAKLDDRFKVLYLVHAAARPVECRRRPRQPAIPHLRHVRGVEKRPVLLQCVGAARGRDTRWKEFSVFVPTHACLRRAVRVRGLEGACDK